MCRRQHQNQSHAKEFTLTEPRPAGCQQQLSRTQVLQNDQCMLSASSAKWWALRSTAAERRGGQPVGQDGQTGPSQAPQEGCHPQALTGR